MNNKFLVALAVASLSVGAYAGSALAIGTGYTYGAGVVASPHNMNTKLATKDSQERVCAFCHTPHHALTDPQLNEYNPLWSHEVSTATFTGYASSTLDAVSADSVNQDVLIGPSRLCMSCHDGVIAIGNHYNEKTDQNTLTVGDDWGQISVGDAVGTSLKNDHPIGFEYDLVADKEKNGTGALAMIQGIKESDQTFSVTIGTAATVQRPIKDLLYKTTGTTPKYIMTCASCHDVHNKENPEGWLLINKQKDSAICTTCHIK